MAGQSSSVGESYREKGMAAPLLLGITQGTNLIINLAICSLRGKLGQGWLAKGDPGRKTGKVWQREEKRPRCSLPLEGGQGTEPPGFSQTQICPILLTPWIHPNPHHSQGFYHVLKLGEAERPGWEGQQSGQKMRLGGQGTMEVLRRESDDKRSTGGPTKEAGKCRADRRGEWGMSRERKKMTILWSQAKPSPPWLLVSDYLEQEDLLSTQ